MMLKMEGVHAHYGHIHALRGIDVEVQVGEIVTLIGANGAGKSTLMMSLFGNPKASAGRIVFDGEDITRVHTHEIARRGIALVPEGRRIFPRMTVIENLQMGTAHADPANYAADTARVFAMFPILEERQAQRAGTLSGGEQQMLAIGRAPETVAASGFSLVPEGRQVFGSMTVLENLRIGTGLRRNALAVAADLEYLLDVFPLLRERAHGQAGLLSGGQQQMLVIARALMAAPRLLAIDEPSLGLAPRVTDQVYEALLRLRAERDLTLLIVEQSASRALLTGGRMVMLREGGIVLEGDPHQITAQQMQQAYFGYDAAPAAMHA